MCILIDDESLKERRFQNIREGSIANFIKSYLKEGTKLSTLTARSMLLEKLARINCTITMRVLDLRQVSINQIMERIISDIFSSAMECLKKCKCNSDVCKPISYIELDSKLFENLQSNSNIDFTGTSSAPCRKCKTDYVRTLNLGKIVFFVGDQTAMWENIPKSAKLQTMAYQLCAIVEKTSKSHFVAHILRPNSKWYTFDNTKTCATQSNGLKKRQMNFNLLCFASENTVYNQIEGTLDEDIILENNHVYETDSEQIHVNNACGPNSIFHALMCLYVDTPDHFSHVCKDDSILQLLLALKTKDVDVAYAIRADILRKNIKNVQQGKVVSVDCVNNIENTLTTIFSETFPSIIMSCVCGKSQRKFSTVGIDYKALTSLGFGHLGKCILLPRRKCDACNSKMKECSLGNIVFVNVQPLSAPKDGINIPEVKIDIANIQSSVIIENISYTLKGIIDYNVSLKHYTLNYHRDDNVWYNFDDLGDKIHRSSSKVLPHLLIFSKNNLS